jgi:hypothetical protein
MLTPYEGLVAYYWKLSKTCESRCIDMLFKLGKKILQKIFPYQWLTISTSVAMYSWMYCIMNFPLKFLFTIIERKCQKCWLFLIAITSCMKFNSCLFLARKSKKRLKKNVTKKKEHHHQIMFSYVIVLQWHKSHFLSPRSTCQSISLTRFTFLLIDRYRILFQSPTQCRLMDHLIQRHTPTRGQHRIHIIINGKHEGKQCGIMKIFSLNSIKVFFTENLK